ncbi:MAG: GT4 family glycosyltransferase PelF [Armatimonadota bacterium]|nr:GT4 family glycosyltransferase PelF [bacterium]MDW8322405.1 GT4 family glycosyltransferase PelF [Armatimonadota bacterium]
MRSEKVQRSPVNRRKVLVLHATYQLGGAERVLQRLLTSLASYLDVHVCALYELGVVGEQMQQAGVPVYALHGRSRTDWRVLPRFVRLVRRVRPETVLTIDSPYPLLYAVLARRIGLIPKLVVSVRTFAKAHRQREMAIARRLASGVVDVLIALSETQKRVLLEEGWKARRVEVIPNGIDLQRFSPAGDNLREQWRIPPQTPVFGIVSMLRPEKNVSLFLKAAQHVLAAIPQAKAFVVGDGVQRAELEQMATQLHIQQQTVFTGVLEQIPAVWRTMDVAVLTSRVEGLPNVLIEAAACGVPAVSTDVGAVRDVVLDGETGYVVPLPDEHALAERILYLLEHPDERKRMGEHARQHAEAHFDLRQMVDRYARVLADV